AVSVDNVVLPVGTVLPPVQMTADACGAGAVGPEQTRVVREQGMVQPGSLGRVPRVTGVGGPVVTGTQGGSVVLTQSTGHVRDQCVEQLHRLVWITGLPGLEGQMETGDEDTGGIL